MKVKMILPALSEAKSIYWRPLKYSLFPPLGLATLAGFLSAEDDIEIQDEHVEALFLDDAPDLVVIQVYVTSAYRAYEIADHYRRKGAYVVLGGVHVTSLPSEAALHADSIFLGPGEDTWPQFLSDFRKAQPKSVYSSTKRSLLGMPSLRRDLINRHLYLVPNSLLVSRGCPHHCDFCYKESFFQGGKSFYTQAVDDALYEIHRLPGKHLFFLDDHLFGNERFAASLFEGMKGMSRVWQAAGTVESVLRPQLIEKAVDCGLKSLFVGFESIKSGHLAAYNKHHNSRSNYDEAVERLHDLGVMINGSFVFGLDEDGPDVFDRTVDWAISHGIETATFHILTPYPGTALYERLLSQGRLIQSNWNFYDTRHAVFTPAQMSAEALENGYWKAYKTFYKWGSIIQGANCHDSWKSSLRHLAYAGAWKKCEPFWNFMIKNRQIQRMRPFLEAVLSGGQKRTTQPFQSEQDLSFLQEDQISLKDNQVINTASLHMG